jgi:hypothetical protein
MLREFKHIHFVTVARKAKTSVWSCRNNQSNQELGQIRWHPAWRQYCFFTTIDAVYSPTCLDDIVHFIRISMAQRRTDPQ